MKHLLCLTLILVLGCTNSNQNQKDGKHHQILANKNQPSSRHTEVDTLQVIEPLNSSFESFLIKFSSDEEFQLTSVSFPLTFKLLDIEDIEEKQVIVKGAWEHMNLLDTAGIQTKDVDAYSQQIEARETKAIIKRRGIDNGIRIDYKFQLKEGKWFLIEIVDAST